MICFDGFDLVKFMCFVLMIVFVGVLFGMVVFDVDVQCCNCCDVE